MYAEEDHRHCSTAAILFLWRTHDVSIPFAAPATAFVIAQKSSRQATINSEPGRATLSKYFAFTPYLSYGNPPRGCPLT